MSEEKRNSFDVIVKSSGSLEHFGDINKISHFKNSLPTENILDGKWQVGATSYQYPKSWMNLTENACIFFLFKQGYSGVKRTLSKGNDCFTYKIIIPEGSYTTPQSLIDTIYSIGGDVVDFHQETITPVDEVNTSENKSHSMYRNLASILNISYSDNTSKYKWRMPSFKILSLGDDVEFKEYKQVDIWIPVDEFAEYRYFEKRNDDNIWTSVQISDYIKSNKILGDLLGLKMVKKPMNGGQGHGYLLQVADTSPEFSPYKSKLSSSINTLWVSMPGLIDNRIVGDKYLPILGTIPAGLGEDGGYVKYSVQNVIYLDLIPRSIQDIEIKVTDSKLQKIPFKDFQGDFVVHLKFRKKPKISNIDRTTIDEKFIYLDSSASMKEYPDNHSSEFTNVLPINTHFPGEWEVALTEVSYDKTMIHLKYSHIIKINYSLRGADRRAYRLYIHLNQGQSFNSPQEVCEMFNEGFYKPAAREPDSDGWTYHKGQPYIKMSYLASSNRFCFTIASTEDNQIKDVVLNFELYVNEHTHHVVDPTKQELIDLFGIYNDKDPGTPQSRYYLTQGDAVIMPAPPDLHKQAYNIWLSSLNLVELTQIGSVYQDLMDTIPLEGDFGKYVHYVFENRNYKKLVKKDVNTIHMKLANSEGVPLPLSGARHTLVGLHFKPIIDQVYSEEDG